MMSTTVSSGKSLFHLCRVRSVALCRVPIAVPVAMAFGFMQCLFGSGCAQTESGKKFSTAQPDTEHTTQAKVDSRVFASGTAWSEAPRGSDISVRYRNDHLPDWAINPGLGGVVGAVGVAMKNDLGIKEQLEEARLSGRLELASMLEVRLQKIGRTELEQHIRVATGKSNDSRKSALAIERYIQDIVLAGSRQQGLWFDPFTEECYVWIVLDGALFDKANHYIINGVSVFIAEVPVATEYLPERRREKPQAPPLPPAPAPSKKPIEQMEESLRPIQTIPLKEEVNTD